MKTWASPLTVNASGVVSARLYAKLCGTENSVNLTVANGTGAAAGTATLTAPVQATLGRGVWTLQLRTDCGCYSMPVAVNTCPPPSVSPDNGGGGGSDSDEPIPTCDPDDDTTYCPVFGC